MNLNAIKALIQDSLDDVEDVIDEQLNSPVSLIKEISTHLIRSGGKRIRPMLVILVYHAYGCEGRADIMLAAALELIHAATLLHDDVVDNSKMRRNEATASAIWDNSAAVLVGDFLYSRAFQLIVGVQDFSVLSMLASSTNIVATGEVLQLQNRHNPDISEDNYIDVLRYKTGALFSAATQAGAIAALRPEEEIKLMAEFGEALGIAFQLADDRLDYCADPETLGKNLGDDLADGKITMPLLHALKNANANDKNFIRQAIMTGDRESLPRLQQIIQACDSLNYTSMLAKRYVEKANNCLQILQDGPYKEALSALTDLVVNRQA
jgi:octaprenyl-diphosphate synthase